jgi:3-phosphoshikimate 1-carboxyvinyltransferase
MAEFKVRVYYDTDWSFFIFGGQEYRAKNFSVEGDWSSAAFIEALNHIGGDVKIDGLNEGSLQGDKICLKYFTMLDGGFCEMDISNCPDLGPILFTMAAIKDGARFTGTKRLRDKESDRIEAMRAELEKFGARIEVIDGQNGGTVNVLPAELHSPKVPLSSHNDHRIAMSLSVLALRFGGEIEGAEAVKKSMPDFFENLESLGAHVTKIERI